MKIGLLTNEFPPHIYGGAGVHVEYLVREMGKNPKHELKVFYFGQDERCLDNISVQGCSLSSTIPSDDPRRSKFLEVLFKDLIIVGGLEDVDVIHCHTWYTHLAGCLLKPILKVPLVLTTHSLEPQRPWKAEQLGPAYRASTWIEKTAYQQADGVIAVSRPMKKAVHQFYGVPYKKIRVIHNGIDTQQYKPDPNPAVLSRFEVNPQIPYILFVGRITRQKGLNYFLDMIPYLLPEAQIVICAASPDTEELAREIEGKIASLRNQNQRKIVWISHMLSRETLIPLYSQAALFICPSIYEPFGIINLEAMACETPVIASAVGGIPEIVSDKKTGLLVPFEPISPNDPTPRDPLHFAQDLAKAANQLLSQPEKRRAMGLKARKRVEEYFSWGVIARQTLDFYAELIRSHPEREFPDTI